MKKIKCSAWAEFGQICATILIVATIAGTIMEIVSFCSYLSSLEDKFNRNSLYMRFLENRIDRMDSRILELEYPNHAKRN